MADRATMPRNGSSSVLWKAFDVLETFSQHKRFLTLSEVARLSGLPKSTVHRVLGMLVEVGAVEQQENGFRIGLRMLSVASCSPEGLIRDAAMPHLLDLHKAVGRTIHLAVLQGTDVLYLEKLYARNTQSSPTDIGVRLPAHCTGVGKALLAHAPAETLDALCARPLPTLTPHSLRVPAVLRRHLDRVRSTGVAFDHGEASVGLSCVARPVLVAGRAVASVSIGFRSDEQADPALTGVLARTTTAVARSLITRRDYHQYPSTPI
ncbi:IclR family transcriptional regulator [Streptomyces sp. NPDC090088]|uniref:IclR family transcriptional regulator n=1 Tax=Streptomyces sp. NPDC090088 TaxID=3365944 RepID=UPI00380DB22D